MNGPARLLALDAPALLRAMRDEGFTLTPAGADGIRVAPAACLSDTHRDVVRLHRAAILALLKGQIGCENCTYRSPVNTCLDPVGAGLADGFCIRWCDEAPGRGDSCRAWTPKART